MTSQLSLISQQYFFRLIENIISQFGHDSIVPRPASSLKCPCRWSTLARNTSAFPTHQRRSNHNVGGTSRYVSSDMLWLDIWSPLRCVGRNSNSRPRSQLAAQIGAQSRRLGPRAEPPTGIAARSFTVSVLVMYSAWLVFLLFGAFNYLGAVHFAAGALLTASQVSRRDQANRFHQMPVHSGTTSAPRRSQSSASSAPKKPRSNSAASATEAN